VINAINAILSFILSSKKISKTGIAGQS